MKLQSSKYPLRKLEELAVIARGSSPRPIKDQKYFEGGTIPWIKIADATASGKYLYKTKQYVNEYGASFSRKLKPGSLIIAASGTLGYTQFLGVEGCVHDGWLYFVELKDIDKEYLYYTLQWMRQHFFNQAYGAAIQNINTDILRNTEIPYPPLKTQKEIGEVLATYDSLIENNTRRIAILEEMAQSIYREWFVKFCFPGHENSKFIDSPLGKIPEGWEVKPIAEEIEILGGGTPSKKTPEYWDEVDADINWYTPSDLTKSSSMFMEESSLKITDIGLVKSSAKLFPPYSVMMTSRATIGVISVNTTTACTNQGFIICVPNDRISTEYIYYWLYANMQKIDNLASGATFKEVRRTLFKELPFLVPSNEIHENFCSVVKPITKLIEKVENKNRNLKYQRDSLLPKLISGSIAV